MSRKSTCALELRLAITGATFVVAGLIALCALPPTGRGPASLASHSGGLEKRADVHACKVSAYEYKNSMLTQCNAERWTCYNQKCSDCGMTAHCDCRVECLNNAVACEQELDANYDDMLERCEDMRGSSSHSGSGGATCMVEARTYEREELKECTTKRWDCYNKQCIGCGMTAHCNCRVECLNDFVTCTQELDTTHDTMLEQCEEDRQSLKHSGSHGVNCMVEARTYKREQLKECTTKRWDCHNMLCIACGMTAHCDCRVECLDDFVTCTQELDTNYDIMLEHCEEE